MFYKVNITNVFLSNGTCLSKGLVDVTGDNIKLADEAIKRGAALVKIKPAKEEKVEEKIEEVVEEVKVEDKKDRK